MALTESGGVGIGTSNLNTVDTKLQVVGDTHLEGRLQVDDELVVASNLKVTTTTGVEPTLQVNQNVENVAIAKFFGNDDMLAMALTESGGVGIGTSNLSTTDTKLEVNGDIYGRSNISADGLISGSMLDIGIGSMECDDESLTINVHTELNKSMNIYVEDENNLGGGSNVFKIGYSNEPDWVQLCASELGKLTFGIGVSNLEYKMMESYVNGDSKALIIEGGDLIMSSNVNITVEEGGYYFGDGQKLLNIDAAQIVNITGPLHSNIFPVSVKFIVEDNSDSNQLEVIGDMFVHSNLKIEDDLFIKGHKFPIPSGPGDRGKVLATNSNGDFEMVTVFSEVAYSEFKSLHGVRRTGVQMEEISGVFDFGVTKYWLEGWEGKVFDCTLNNLAPSNDGTSIEPNSLINVESITASNNLHFVNISLVKENGVFLSSNCGIATGPPSLPNYYYFLGVLDPNTALFRNKFKTDFEYYFKDRHYAVDPQKSLGYVVDVDYISMPHESLHVDGTKFYTVEFINAYSVEDYVVDGNLTTRYKKDMNPVNRRTKYYKYNADDLTPTYSLIVKENYGLYPHITYKKWKNMEKTNEVYFYERPCVPELGWSSGGSRTPDVSSVFAKFSSYEPMGGKDWMYKLWLRTYLYIFEGNAYGDILNYDETTFKNVYDMKVRNAVMDNHNILLVTNLNEHLDIDQTNGQSYVNNYSILFSSNAFPTEQII